MKNNKISGKSSESSINSSLELVAKSSVIVFLGVALSKVISYAYKIIIARNFGPEYYGIFTIALTIASLFVGFFSIGLPDGLIRFIPLYSAKKDKGKIRNLLELAYISIIFSSLVAGGVLYFSSEFIAEKMFHNLGLIRYLKFFSYSIPISAVAGFYLAIIKGNKKIGTYSFIVNVVQNFSRLALILLFIFLGFGPDSVIFSYLAGLFIFACFSYFASRKFVIESKKAQKGLLIDKSLTKELFSYSWPIMFLGAVSTAYYVLDSFVLGYFLDVSHVGYYSVAFSTITLLGVAPELFMQLFLPLMVNNYSKRKYNEIREISKQVSKWIFILNVPLLLVMLIYPGAIINLFFGRQYLVAKNVVRILALVNFFSSSIVPISNSLLQMTGKSKVLLANIITTLFINFILNVLLIPRYGIMGAALGTSASWIILNVLLLAEVKYYVSIYPIRRKVLRIFLVSLIPTIVFIIVKNYFSISLLNLILSAFLLTSFYVVLLFVFNCLDKNDLIVIQYFKKRLTFV